MASREKMNPDSDDEVDLEALRLAALQSLHNKPKFPPRINHNNLIPIVPVHVVAPIIVHPTIKLEPISPTLEENIQVNSRLGSPTKDEEERDSLETETDPEIEEDILSMDDKEEEDSLERLMDQLEAEISGKAPIPSNRTVIAPKKSLNELKGHRKGKRSKKRDVEVELVEVKIGKQQGPIISIRESASPELGGKDSGKRNSITPVRSRSPKRNSRSPRKSRSRSPFRRSRSYRRSNSPYWSKSPRRSRSPFWMSRRSKSPLRKSRSPYRRSKSPFARRRSPFRYSSRTRSRSFDRRSRSPWSYSPRKRSRSPYFRDSYSPFHRRRNILSPDGKSRKRSSLSPRGKSRSPRRRSRSPRRYMSGRRNSPFHHSKSPMRRSRSPVRNKSPFRRIKSPYRRSTSPFLRRTNSPMNSTDSTQLKRRSPGKAVLRRSKSVGRRSFSPGRRPKSPARSLRGNSKSPSKRNDVPRRSPRRSMSKSKRSRSFSTSPRRRNASPLRSIDKNKMDDGENAENAIERGRQERRPRSLSKDRKNENYIRQDRRPYRSRGFRRFSPTRGRRSAERQRKRSRSPKKKVGDEKNKGSEAAKNLVEGRGISPVPVDPVLEARKRKFENLGEVDPTVDKKISLKSIKEPSDNTAVEDDEDALNINIEGDLWEESEESENEHESRFKTGEARMKTNRTVLSFRNLRDDDSKKMNINKPLIDDTRRDKYNSNRFDRWPRGRRNDRSDRNHRKRYRDEDGPRGKSDRSSNRDGKLEPSKNKAEDEDQHASKKAGRKVIVFSSPQKVDAGTKDNEVSTTSNATKDGQSGKVGDGFDKLNGAKDKHEKNRETDDFDKLISDFEKELESDICLPAKEASQTMPGDHSEVKRLRISVKKDLFEPQPNQNVKKPLPSASRSSDATSAKERGKRFDVTKRTQNELELGEIREPDDKPNQPEDYVEDDDFALDEGTRRVKTRTEDEDGQNDLRDILSRRRNQRLTKVVTLQESMPARLVKSAFQGLGNKKPKRSVKELQGSVELSTSDVGLKVVGMERRRVLLLQRKKPDVPSFKVTVPEVKPDTTIHQRLSRGDERKRNRLLQKQLDVNEMDQEEEECFEAEDKQPRRVRLKRNVTLSSQVASYVDLDKHVKHSPSPKDAFHSNTHVLVRTNSLNATGWSSLAFIPEAIQLVSFAELFCSKREIV